MSPFLLKTHNPKKNYPNPHFFILNKGNNSGKPLLEPCPNCFVLTCSTELERQQLFFLIQCLWKAKGFWIYLRGSVIPFLSIRDCKTVVSQAYEKAMRNHEVFAKSMSLLSHLDKKEDQFNNHLNSIKELKAALLFRYIQSIK